MPSEAKLQKKGEYFEKLVSLLDTYKRIILVGCDNIGSKHMQDIRTALRGDAVLLMGKKTMMRKAIRDHLEKNPSLEALVPFIHGNVGFVFTNKDLAVVRSKLTQLKVNAPAKAGAIAPNDVIVKAGPTGMDPTQTSFLQALNIASKINKGQVEIVSDVLLLHEGDKVGQSEAALLGKLNINPFIYGLIPQIVYDNGLVYDTKVLDMSDEDVFARMRKGLQAVAAIGLAIGYPTAASVPHSLIRGFKNVVALALETSYSFKQADLIKEALKNPVAAAPAAVQAAAPAKEAKKEAKEEKKPKEEPKEEEEADMGLDLFG